MVTGARPATAGDRPEATAGDRPEATGERLPPEVAAARAERAVQAGRAAVAVKADARCGVLLTIAYDGSAYAGFTPQRGLATVGGEVLTELLLSDPTIDGLRVASRTDAGVHALAQPVAFDAALEMPSRAWVLALIPRLPASIAVKSATRVALGLHPAHVTASKTYRYLVLSERLPDPFWARRAWRAPGCASGEQLELMRAELDCACGTHDFAAFRSSSDGRDNTERTITAAAARVLRSQPKLLAIDVSGDAFMHNMVRIIVGTVIDVARGRLAPGAVGRALSSGQRSDGGITAPPDGLYLRSVQLRPEISRIDSWPQSRD